MRERYVLLGLARARADWFRTVGQWANAGVLPVEFLRCVSAEELRTRLRSGRPFSAVLVAADVPGLDRDLVAEARSVGTAVIVVDDEPARRDWRELGAAAVLGPSFSRDDLLDALGATSELVGGATLVEDEPVATASGPGGHLVAVTGPGGTGASTVAIALAQGIAAGTWLVGPPGASGSGAAVGRARSAQPPSVLLADLCLTADQAMLHDARTLVPGVQELVEAHRTAVPRLAELHEQTFEVPERGYRLLLGLRRRRHWATLRPRAVGATLDSLQRLADVVVADVESEVDGEAETGSLEVEDRNLLARATMARADVVAVVGEPSMKGIVALVRTIADLLGFGVPIERLLPVLARSPRSPRQRGELGRSVAELLTATAGAASARMCPVLHLPARDLDPYLRDGSPLPAPLPRSTARAVAAVLERAGAASAAAAAEPERIQPGQLSGFTPQEGLGW
jgi:hypothetical protein